MVQFLCFNGGELGLPALIYLSKSVPKKVKTGCFIGEKYKFKPKKRPRMKTKVQKAVQYAMELHDKSGVSMEEAADIALDFLLARKTKQPAVLVDKTK